MALALTAGCRKAAAPAGAAGTCGSCHVPHRVAEGACQDCHRGDPSASRRELAHHRLLTGRAAEHLLTHGPAVTEGARLVEAAGCRRCHTIAGSGNRLATDLDSVVGERTQAELSTSITSPVENMPRFGFDDAQAEAIIAYLLRHRGQAGASRAYRVHFTRAADERATVFEDKCGGCHRVLGPLGPLGVGSAGPNLSGLFTLHYPPTAPGERPWTAAALADWLRNPRAGRPSTTMPPVSLTDDERRQLTEQLGGGEAPPAR